MKKKLNRIYSLIFCIFCLPFIAEAQTSSNCAGNINAGGDASYCITDNRLFLAGSWPGTVGNTAWSIVNQPSGSSTVTIVDITNLNTFVTNAGGFSTGNYDFVLTGTCPDGTIQTDTVTISILPPVTQPTITDAAGNPIITMPYTVCRIAELLGATPAAGETGVWSSGPGISFNIDGDTLFGVEQVTSTCVNRTYYYTISNNGCAQTDSIEVEYERGPIHIQIIDNYPSCGDTIAFSGGPAGCNGTGQWQIIPPAGVATPNVVTINPVGTHISYAFTESGNYQLIYTLTSTGVCPSGSDTLDITICVSAGNGIGEREVLWYCGNYPDTFNLSAAVSGDYIYENWQLVVPTSSSIQIDSTGIGQAQLTNFDNAVNGYTFIINAGSVPCIFNDEDTVDCPVQKRVDISLFRAYEEESDTLNIFCHDPNTYYRPVDFITSAGGFYQSVTPTQVPACSNTITVGDQYHIGSLLDFSCEGTYIFNIAYSTTAAVDGALCEDSLLWVVNVTSLQNPSAGSNASINLCVNDSITLVGSTPIDLNGIFNSNVIVGWEQINITSPATIVSPNSQTTAVTNFTTPGIYQFEYFYAREADCYLSDTMEITVDTCTNDCPDFNTLTYCDLIDESKKLNYTITPEIEKVLSDYYTKMGYVKGKSESDPCCDYCNSPDETFPIFIFDENGDLADNSVYNISWSHDPSNSNAWAMLLPNQSTIVTVNGPNNCIWTDTFKIDCCTDTVEIISVCAWEPCDYPNSPIPLYVQDQDNNILTLANYSFQWSNGQTGNAIAEPVSSLPISVIVTDLQFPLCIYTDTFSLDCCTPTPPINLSCKVKEEPEDGYYLNWDMVANADHYIVQILYNDPECCGDGKLAIHEDIVLSNAHFIAFDDLDFPCFSWHVISVCESGEKSDPSEKVCACSPLEECKPDTPEKLDCEVINEVLSYHFSWDPVTGADHYIVIINLNDPLCCEKSDGITSTHDFTTATNDITILMNELDSDCFSWQVIAVCPDGTKSESSAKACACDIIEDCKPEKPEKLDCKVIENPLSYHFSWDPVTGVDHYIVIIYANDPICCPKSDGISSTIDFTTYTNSFDVLLSTLTTDCFSWQVIAVCPDGTKSPSSDKVCACSLVDCKTDTPTGLSCARNTTGDYMLSWNNVPGAIGYEVTLLYNDPLCCPNSSGIGFVQTITTTAPSHVILQNNAKCMSFYVQAICPNGSVSNQSDKICLCLDDPIPAIPKTKAANSGNSSLNSLKLSAIPNPAYETVKISLTNNENENVNGAELIISDISGKILYRSIYSNQQIREIDVSHFSPGIYLYSVVQFGQVLAVDKFCIE